MSDHQMTLVVGALVFGVVVKLYDEIIDGQVENPPPGVLAFLQSAQVGLVALAICLSTTAFFYMGITAVAMAIADAFFSSFDPSMGTNLDTRFYVALSTAVAVAFCAMLLVERVHVRVPKLLSTVVLLAVIMVTDMAFFNEECSRGKAAFRAAIIPIALVACHTSTNADEAAPYLSNIGYVCTWFAVKHATGQLHESFSRYTKCGTR